MRLGRRGTALRLLAPLWLLMGSIVAATGHDIDPCDAIWYESLPAALASALWTSTGLVALAAAYRVTWQNAGWWALALMPAERALSHAYSLAHGLIPGEPPGTTWAGAASMLLWAGIVHLVILLAGWDEDTCTERDQ